MPANILHKKILVNSLIILMISIVGLIISLSASIEDLIVACILLACCSIGAILTSYAVRFQDNIILRRSSFISIFVVVISGIYLAFLPYNEYNFITFVIPLIIAIISVLLALIYVFVLTDATSLTAIFILIFIFLIGLFFKRLHFPGAGLLLTSSSVFLGGGSFLYGIRCMFISEKISYLKNLSFYGGLIILISFLGLSFKIQHWTGAGLLATIGLITMIASTFYLLMSFHTSGFTEWKLFHKKILRRLLIPWTLVFVLFIMRFLLPDLNAKIWSPDRKYTFGFSMSDYPVENKNGLEIK
jgi:hypothetical protein